MDCQRDSSGLFALILRKQYAEARISGAKFLADIVAICKCAQNVQSFVALLLGAAIPPFHIDGN